MKSEEAKIFCPKEGTIMQSRIKDRRQSSNQKAKSVKKEIKKRKKKDNYIYYSKNQVVNFEYIFSQINFICLE